MREIASFAFGNAFPYSHLFSSFVNTKLRKRRFPCGKSACADRSFTRFEQPYQMTGRIESYLRRQEPLPMSLCEKNRMDTGHPEIRPANPRGTARITHRRSPTRREVGKRGERERDALYAEFAPLVRKLVRVYGTEQELREELPGEIYCRFCAILSAYDPERGVPLHPYIVRQLTASVYTFARHQWRRSKREILLEPEHREASATLIDPSPLWNEGLMLQHLQSGLPQAFDLLSSRQRQVVIWRYYESQSFEEIASRLNVRVSTARSILRHGLHNIRRRMEEANYTYC